MLPRSLTQQQCDYIDRANNLITSGSRKPPRFPSVATSKFKLLPLQTPKTPHTGKLCLGISDPPMVGHVSARSRCSRRRVRVLGLFVLTNTYIKKKKGRLDIRFVFAQGTASGSGDGVTCCRRFSAALWRCGAACACLRVLVLRLWDCFHYGIVTTARRVDVAA